MKREESSAQKPVKRMQRVCLVLLLANIVVYLVLLISGVHWLEPEVGDLLRWGGNYAPFTLTEEPWRLFSSMFLHAGIWHLVINMYMLFFIGRLVEKQYGSIRFAVIYLLSGLGGSLLSAFWYGYRGAGIDTYSGHSVYAGLNAIVSVGASGALMGLAGACFVALLTGARHIDAPYKDEEYKAIGQVIFLNLVMGFIVKDIDQACHIGGLLTGGLTGFLLMRSSRPQSTLNQVYFPLLLGCVGVFTSIWLASQGSSEELREIYQLRFQEQQAMLEQAEAE